MKYIESFVAEIEKNYEAYKEKSLKNRRFKHKDITPLLENLKKYKLFKVTELGKSTEGRKISLIKLGAGKTTVLIWSQMHGDEPTATQALFDIFNFFNTEDQLNDVRKTILNELTLYFIPMLNPDGAEVFKRRNALDIDLNRDAAKLEAVETKLLKSIWNNIQARYGFNLHDQEIYYTAGACEKPATISFLAPSFNYEQDIDKKRIASMELIVLMNQVLQKRIPGQVGRYNDDFMPTAIGDNMQLWGTSTILFEAGGYKNDPEKQYVRQWNFLSMMAAFYALAYNYSANFELMDYFSIPENKKNNLFDLLIRNVQIEKNGQQFQVDIGIRRKEIDNEDHTDFTYQGKVVEIGDLTYLHGYEEIDAAGLKILRENNKENYVSLGENANFKLINSKGKIEINIENGFQIVP